MLQRNKKLFCCATKCGVLFKDSPPYKISVSGGSGTVPPFVVLYFSACGAFVYNAPLPSPLTGGAALWESQLLCAFPSPIKRWIDGKAQTKSLTTQNSCAIIATARRETVSYSTAVPHCGLFGNCRVAKGLTSVKPFFCACSLYSSKVPKPPVPSVLLWCLQAAPAHCLTLCRQAQHH